MKIPRFKLPVLLAAAILLPAQLQAVPAWSRQAGVTCSACHATPTMQLNTTGLDFLKNGHRAEPFGFDTSTVNLHHYVSFVWKGRVYYTSLDSARTNLGSVQKPRTNFEQHSFSLYTGGPIADRFSYFTEMYFNENTGATSGSNIVQGDASRKKLAEAFLQYNHPISDDTFVAVRAGEILPEILHVFGIGARSAEQRATIWLDFLPGSTSNYRPFTRQFGVDAKLNAARYELTLGMVNGSNARVTNSIDSDSHKDIYLGGLLKLDEHESAIGLFHYDGKFSVYTTIADPSTPLLYKNSFTRTGLLGRFVRDNWRVVGAYLIGDETINAAGAKADNEGYYALVDYNFNDKYGVFARYDRLDPNTDIGRNEISGVLFGLNVMLYQNEVSGARFSLEYSIKDTYAGGTISTAGTTKYTDNQLFAQITWGF